MPAQSPDSPEFHRDYWIWLPLAIASCWLAWKFQDGFISDWDTFDYTAHMIHGEPTALGLGRALFLGFNRLIWLIAHKTMGLKPENAYLILRYSSIALTGPTIIGVYALYKELSSSFIASTIGALLFVNSPFFISYSGRGMSEIPGFFGLIWGAWWMFRSIRKGSNFGYLLGAAAFGLSANLREFAIFYFPVVALAGLIRHAGVDCKVWRPLQPIETLLEGWGLTLSRLPVIILVSLIATVAVFSGPIFWLIYWPDYYISALKGWYTLSAHERVLHPVNLAHNWQLIQKFGYQCSTAAITTAPFALAWLALRLVRERRAQLWPIAFLATFGWLGTLSMLENHDLEVNPRYLLIMMPGVALSCGWLISDLFSRNYLLTAVCIVYLGYFGMREQWPDVANQFAWEARASFEAKAYLDRIRDCDPKSVFIVGARTPLVNFYHAIAARPDWQTIAAGAGWPDDNLEAEIDSFLNRGYSVYVDFDPELWKTGDRKESREQPGLDRIRQEYNYQNQSRELCKVTGKR